jgi:hypothetical protein
MALRKRGEWWYGDSQADIREELTRVGRLNEYVPDHFADARCVCGGRTFRLQLDEGTAAVRVCTNSDCARSQPIGDSNEYLDDAELQECACPCGGKEFEITVGVQLYAGSEDVKWVYLGCRCVACGLTANYGDWKNELNGYREFLARV